MSDETPRAKPSPASDAAPKKTPGDAAKAAKAPAKPTAGEAAAHGEARPSAATPTAPANVPSTPKSAPTAASAASPRGASQAAASPAASPPAVSQPTAPAAPAKPPAPPPVPPSGDCATLAAEIPGSTHAVPEDGVPVLTVPADDLPAAARRVRELGYPVLSLLSAYDRTDHFGVLYAFVRLAATPAEFGEMRLRVTMPKADGEPTCPSLVEVFPGADWQEREMYDMYGIRFQGHPDLRRMFLPDDWTGHPMRKDYKEPEQFVGLREGEDVTVKTAQNGAW